MFCHNCGNEIAEGTVFCTNCGAKIGAIEGADKPNASAPTNTYGSQDPKIENAKIINASMGEVKIAKYKKIISITNIVLGAILLLESYNSDYDWTLAPFGLGVCICTSGILQLLKKNPKIVAIIQIVLGALTALVSSELTYDWEYVGFVAGAGLLVFGILGLLKKPIRIISIVEIVFGGVIVLLGVAFIEWVWGDTGLFCGAAFLVEGILNLINEKNR